MERQPSWTGHAKLGLALAGICAVTLHLWVSWGSGSAFVPSAPLGMAPLKRQATARPAGLAEPFSDQGGGAAWSLGAAGSVLLICSMVTRQRGLGFGRKAQHGARRWQVTTCHAFGLGPTCPLPASRRVQNHSQDGPRMPSTVTTSCTMSSNVPGAVQTAAGFMEPQAAGRSKDGVSNHRQAFCVNGVRRPSGRSVQRRTSSAPFASRTARRSAGARLQRVPEVTSNPAVAYDPSRLRTKLQHGLQVSRQSGNSARHGECKLLVACNRRVDQADEVSELHFSIVANMFSQS